MALTPLVLGTVRLWQRLTASPAGTPRRLALQQRIVHRLDRMTLRETDQYYNRLCTLRAEAARARAAAEAAVTATHAEEEEWP